jgi:hypothetical protein
MKKNIIAIYPGRFQPFGPHHKLAYDWLAAKFGANNTYIVTSNKVEPPRSPFNFIEKQKIIAKHGIPASKIIQSKNPYQALELLGNLDPDTTSAVFMYGEKDAGRLKYTKKDGSPGYFQLYDPKQELAPYTEHGYVIVSPDSVGVTIPGIGRLSGTVMRDQLAVSDPELFKKIMGWYDSKLYQLITTKLSQSISESINGNIKRIVHDIINQTPVKFNKSIIQHIIGETLNPSILMEGGAYGHMSHPFDDRESTFSELDTMIYQVLSGELDVQEEPVREKTDGQNIMITYRDGKVLAARNKTTIKDPIDISNMKLKFQGRGDLEDAFVQAMEDLESAFKHLPKQYLNDTFQGGRVFLNVEILYPKTKNIIEYSEIPYLIPLGLMYYDDQGNAIREVPKAGPELYDAIKKVNSDIQSTFTIIPPNIVQLQRVPDFDSKYREYSSMLKKIAKSANESMSSTIQDYMDSMWRSELELEFPDLSSDHIEQLVTRWSKQDKSVRLDAKTFGDSVPQLKEFESKSVKNLNKQFINPLNILFLQVGSTVLTNINTYLSASPDRTIKSIRQQIAQIVNQAKSSGDPAVLSKVESELKRLQAAGGLDSIIPSEGILYWYNNKLYKLTGTFAPINQLIGLFKYSR